MLMAANRSATAATAAKIHRITWIPVMLAGLAMPRSSGSCPGIGWSGLCCIGPYAPPGPARCGRRRSTLEMRPVGRGRRKLLVGHCLP